MTRHLCISVTLLDGLFHGKGDGDEPEWPPSPMRLFQALVAGSRPGCPNGDWSNGKAEAYCWLERREPPVIVAPTARRAAEYTFFVPNNDSDKEFDRQKRLTSKIARPHRIAGEAHRPSTLHYLWRITDDDWVQAQAHVEVLCREARHLTALGWGIDQSVADGRVLVDPEAMALPGQQWRAWGADLTVGTRLRVPVMGTLADLERAYGAFVNRLSPQQTPMAREPRVFETALYLPRGALPPRPVAAFELPDGVAFRQECAIEIAAMLRSLACRCAKADSHKFPGGPEMYVAGHTRDDPALRNGPTPARFSYLPLPTIGHEHADGMIRRLLIVEPFGGDGSHARWARHRLRGQTMRDKDGHERGALLDLWRGSSSAMIGRYVGVSTRWCTVTPVVLPGFADLKAIPRQERDQLTKTERLFLRAVRQADLPIESIESFTLRKAPFWPGSQHPSLYRRPDYLDTPFNRRFPAWHVHLVFREPFAGPLSLGAGRHCGLGLFTADPKA